VESCVLVKNFLAREEVQHFLELIQENQGLFVETLGRGGLGPRYRVIDGDCIRARLPEVLSLGERRLLPTAEKMAGQRLQWLDSTRRSMRIQRYTRRGDGFRWHLDGHSWVILLALKNSNDGQIHVISPQLTRFVKFLLYPLYVVPQVFSILPHQRITLRAGDLLFMSGGRMLHRGITLKEGGERVLMVFTFDELGKKHNWFRDRIARFLNY